MDVVGSQAQADLAAAVRRLGELIITRPLDSERTRELTAEVERLARSYDDAEVVAKEVWFGGRNRVQEFVETGEWPPPPPDGAAMDFDIASIVGGEFNPFGVGATYRREGDEAVGTVTVARTFEGPPGRVHGGIISAVFDEVMGAVFRATGTPSAFTGELSVRFIGPAPIDTELEFRAREVRTDGRKRFLEAEATGPEGVFATAAATFIDMRPEHLANQVL